LRETRPHHLVAADPEQGQRHCHDDAGTVLAGRAVDQDGAAARVGDQPQGGDDAGGRIGEVIGVEVVHGVLGRVLVGDGTRQRGPTLEAVRHQVEMVVAHLGPRPQWAGAFGLHLGGGAQIQHRPQAQSVHEQLHIRRR